MRSDILAIFVPIVFIIGLFAVIAMSIYFKYKAKSTMTERMSPDALGEWYCSNAQAQVQVAKAKAQARAGNWIRVCGLLVGIGLGVFLGILISLVLTSANGAHATFVILSLAMIFGGAGTIGAYFLEQKFDGKSK